MLRKGVRALSIDIPVDEAAQDFKGWLERLPWGEMVRLVDSDGHPVALVVSLREDPARDFSDEEREQRWLALAEKISKAWKSVKTALEVLAEMGR